MGAKKDRHVEEASDREIVITRVFAAQREQVFRAWTDPEEIDQWWGPKGFTNTTHEMNFKPGGTWRFIMHSPDGDDYNNRIVFEEIVKPERLVYSHGSDDEPDQFRVTVTFEDQGDNTGLTMRMLFPTVEDCEQSKRFGAVQGGKSTLDRLESHLSQM